MNIIDVTVVFCINQTNGELYCIQNYPHQNFIEDDIDEDIKDPRIKEDTIYTTMKGELTFTTIILRFNKFEKWYWWGEIDRECESNFEIRHKDSLYCLNDKLYILAVASHRNNSNSQLIRVYDIKQRKFELFCHHINTTSEIVSNTMKFTMLNNRWILIAFNKRNPHKDYYTNNVFELIDLQERKIRKRSQTLTLILSLIHI